MTRVLVVHHDIDIADQEVDSLRRAGYEVVECVGPTGAGRPCPVLRGMSCALADRADVLVYDVWASGATGGGEALIERLREQYPGKPIVLTSPGLEPEWAEEDGLRGVTTLLGTPTRDRLLDAIERALGHLAV
ncbi:MAG: hypothetical protein ACXWMU_04350 [Candidatus Limnocylindrales bacterium]